MQGVKISAPGNSPSTDGIHVQMSMGVTVTGASIKTGDDCISIGPGTANLWIEQVACGPGHGIRLVSLVSPPACAFIRVQIFSVPNVRACGG